MLEKVSLTVPTISKPMMVSVAPSVATLQLSANPHVTITHSVGTSSDSSLRDMQERLSALQKPYPCAPIVTSAGVLGGFYFGHMQTQGQAIGSTPFQFSMGTRGMPSAIKVTSEIGERKMMNEGVKKHILSEKNHLLIRLQNDLVRLHSSPNQILHSLLWRKLPYKQRFVQLCRKVRCRSCISGSQPRFAQIAHWNIISQCDI